MNTGVTGDMQYLNGQVRLSRREAEVTWRVARGLTNREIATELGIAENTLEQYLRNIRQGLRLHGRHELILWALQHPMALQHPQRADERQWVDPLPHCAGCECPAPYCVTMKARLTAT